MLLLTVYSMWFHVEIFWEIYTYVVSRWDISKKLCVMLSKAFLSCHYWNRFFHKSKCIHGFYGFIALFAKFKDAFILTCDIWDNWYKIFLTRNELKALRILWIYWVWYFKGFCEITWNWIVFWFLVNYELFMFLPLGCNMWLLGDYLARYYSLCDIEFWLCVSELVPVLCR